MFINKSFKLDPISYYYTKFYWSPESIRNGSKLSRRYSKTEWKVSFIRIRICKRLSLYYTCKITMKKSLWFCRYISVEKYMDGWLRYEVFYFIYRFFSFNKETNSRSPKIVKNEVKWVRGKRVKHTVPFIIFFPPFSFIVFTLHDVCNFCYDRL